MDICCVCRDRKWCNKYVLEVLQTNALMAGNEEVLFPAFETENDNGAGGGLHPFSLNLLEEFQIAIENGLMCFGKAIVCWKKKQSKIARMALVLCIYTPTRHQLR